MPVKKESRIKNQELKVKPVTVSSRAKRGDLPRNGKIASSKTPRNDKRVSTSSTSLTIPVYSLAGEESGTLALPKEIFDQKVNKQLLSQAIRVYTANQKNFTSSTKTRGEVKGSTAKIYKQKGTGRARHGSIRAPIFVGGGIVFGPKPRNAKLELPQKMRKAALLSALSVKAKDKEILAVSGLEKSSGKTKEMTKLIGKLLAISNLPLAAESQQRKANSVLIVIGDKQDNAARAVNNIPEVDVLPANLINAYEVLKHDLLVLTKDAVEKLSKSQVKEQK